MKASQLQQAIKKSEIQRKWAWLQTARETATVTGAIITRP